MILGASGMGAQDFSGRGGEGLWANASDEGLWGREKSREEEEEGERRDLRIRKHGGLAEYGQAFRKNKVISCKVATRERWDMI